LYSVVGYVSIIILGADVILSAENSSASLEESLSLGNYCIFGISSFAELK
jgi:hypothetical protein